MSTAAALAIDQFQWWRDALAGKTQEIHADHPQSGYFRMRDGKGGPWVPVAIWSDGGVLHCKQPGKGVLDALKVWTWCAANPVSKADFKHAMEHGSWPGDIAIGHNSGDLSLAEEIKEAADQALSWLKSFGIKDKTSMDRAANYRARLIELGKKADTEREGKVRPHLDAQREVNAEYKPLIDSAKTAADTVRAALSVYMAAEDERVRKAAAEVARIENEKRMVEYRRQQEAAAELAKSDELPPVVEAPALVAPEPIKLQAGGQRGKKASLREITRYRLSNYYDALAHLKDHADIVAAVEKAAFAQARAGATVPGVESYIEKVAV